MIQFFFFLNQDICSGVQKWMCQYETANQHFNDVCKGRDHVAFLGMFRVLHYS